MQSVKNPPQKMTQRFCLRWNNHQSNLLSNFDQLLHAEMFTDVTLAVEGQYLKAHKMVLSACSPYFNALFVNHPEKHPIVILKDVPFADMKSLIDFMYRGEVSVDQERLNAFLRVAESLRIKGLTEVNDDKPMRPATPPPPQLHRIQPYLVQQRKNQNAMINSPLLGSALSGPKRKRGRPRKLSGSSNGTGNDFDDYDRDALIQGSPEMLEVKMGTEGYSGNEGSDDNQRESGDNDNEQDSNQERMDTSESRNKSQSKDIHSGKDNDNSTSEQINSSPELTQRLLGIGIGIKTDLETKKIGFSSQLATSSANSSSNNYSNSLLQQQLQNDSLNNNNTTEVSITTANNLHQQYLLQMTNAASSSLNSSSNFYKSNSPTQTNSESGELTIAGQPTSPTSHMTRQPQRRRVRRKATSTLDDQAEHLTEMSVRGLDLFRYASITEGVYQCTECAKENVQKTFKNKYSFQRHAFLYHEGKHRKVFPCPVCGKEFSRPDKMKNHMKTTHECFIPKEVNYHHPLNYLITAAAAGDIQHIFPKMENMQIPENQAGGGSESNLPVTIKSETLATTINSGNNIMIIKNEILEQPMLPNSITEPSISIIESEEVK